MEHKEKAWRAVKRKYRLSNKIILKAKGLGLNPKKLGSLANHQQQPWKEPLLHFINTLYKKRFGNNHVE